MLKDWDFAQFFPNWNAPAGPATCSTAPTEAVGSGSSKLTMTEEKSSSSSPSSATPPRLSHRRNESDSALNGTKVLSSSSSSSPSTSDPLFSSKLAWAGRQRLSREPLPLDEPVSLTEFSRKASQLELRSHKSASTAVDFAPGACPPPPRREKTDLLDLRRQELKKELEERRRGAAAVASSDAAVTEGRSSMTTGSYHPRPPLLKSTSEPCAPLTLFRDHLQVRVRKRYERNQSREI